MRSLAEPCALATTAKHVPAAATAAVVTVAANADQYWVLDWICWSYSAAPTGGRITVTIGGTTYLDHDITAAGPGMLQFYPGPIYNAAATKNEAMVVTLASGAGSVEGKLTIRYR